MALEGFDSPFKLVLLGPVVAEIVRAGPSVPLSVPRFAEALDTPFSVSSFPGGLLMSLTLN